MKSNKVSRRQLIAAPAAAAFSACGNRAPVPKPLVSAVRVRTYGEDLEGITKRVLLDHKVAVRGKRVLLKPNLVEFDPDTCINTHPKVVAAAMEAFRSLGAADVHIAEGPGHRRGMLEMAEAAGYFAAISHFERVVTDLNVDDIFKMTIANPLSRLLNLYLPKTPFRYDLVVSMPKMKTHHWVGVTLSMKNLFGIVPGGVYGWPKNILHWSGIDECIVDLYRNVPAHLAIIDGIDAMEGNGPIQGVKKPAGVLVVGTDLLATDATCCRIMGIDPQKIRYLRLAENNGQTVAGNVQQIGEPIEAIQTRFSLIREWDQLRLEV